MGREFSRRAAVLAFGLALAVGFGVLAAGCGSRTLSESTSRSEATLSVTDSSSTSVMIGVQGGHKSYAQPGLDDYGKDARIPQRAAQAADLVIYGTVTKVDPGVWNSPDGKAWTPSGESDIPSIYRTFYVEPVEILKGEPKWGSPVAFMVLGGTEGVADGPVATGDHVLVLGMDYAAHGGLYGDVYWKKDAYHAMQAEYSVFIETAPGVMESVVDPQDTEYGRVTLSQMRAALAQQ